MPLVFWLLAALMIAVALAFVLVPLLRGRRAPGPSEIEANLAVLRGQRREIEADVAAGSLPADAREEALADLVARAETDLGAPAAVPASARSGAKVAAVVVALALPAVVLGLYLKVGMPDAAVPRTAERPNDVQIAAMVDRLAAKVRDRPNDVLGWTLLARSLAAMGRFPDAVRAFEHLVQLTPADAQVYADYADALAMVQGRSLQGRPYELAKRALELDPHLPKALAIAATATLDAGDYKTSLGYWQALAAEVPEGSEDRQQVDAAIAEVRDRARAAGQTLPQAGPLIGTAPHAPAAAGASITGSVSVAPALAAKVDPNATLFVFARAEGGPRMPLAVLRLPARGLPTTFQLDDSLAMSPQMKISTASAVRIEARVSKSGNAMPQPGDLMGSSAVVKPGARDVAIVIDREAP